MSESSQKQRALRIGTRGSKLARWQANWVADRLRKLGNAVEIVEIATHGDKDSATPLSSFGGIGVFTKEIQRALLADKVDLAVHSLKDLPTEEVPGLMLAAVPTRESPARALVTNDNTPLERLPKATLVGTGSLRRQAQIRNLRPDLRVVDVRGNVDTRLNKVNYGELDAIVLAEAGLLRLGFRHLVTQVLPLATFLPAVGQGALGIECRSEDAGTRSALSPIDDFASRSAVTAERSLLAHLSGGCLAPIGAWARMDGNELRLSAVVLSTDGARRLEAHAASKPNNAAALGRQVADALLAQGAAESISATRASGTS